MKINELKINDKMIFNENGEMEWSIVKNIPTITITDNNHSHTDRYYTKAQVDSRFDLLTTSITELDEKISILLEQRKENENNT